MRSVGFFCSIALALLAGPALAIDLTAASGDHTCVIQDAGVVTCWGWNLNGQSGPAPSLSSPTDISAGVGHNCAIDAAGVTCWGRSLEGQLNVPPMTGIVDLDAGGWHTCAIADQGVVCWGSNTNGQLDVPQAVAHATAISAGGVHTCAIAGGLVHCWGANGAGQLDVPGGLSRPRAISAGWNHTCAIDDVGIHCWGSGDPSVTTVPAGILEPYQVAAGNNHTCALGTNGVFCWGLNDQGQTVVPQNLVDPVLVTVGQFHSCVLHQGGVACWGANNQGQIDVPANLALASTVWPQAGTYEYTGPLDASTSSCVLSDGSPGEPDSAFTLSGVLTLEATDGRAFRGAGDLVVDLLGVTFTASFELSGLVSDPGRFRGVYTESFSGTNGFSSFGGGFVHGQLIGSQLEATFRGADLDILDNDCRLDATFVPEPGAGVMALAALSTLGVLRRFVRIG